MEGRASWIGVGQGQGQGQGQGPAPKRRSSILKPAKSRAPLGELHHLTGTGSDEDQLTAATATATVTTNMNTTTGFGMATATATANTRRVSFSATKGIALFTADQGNTIWHRVFEESHRSEASEGSLTNAIGKQMSDLASEEARGDGSFDRTFAALEDEDICVNVSAALGARPVSGSISPLSASSFPPPEPTLMDRTEALINYKICPTDDTTDPSASIADDAHGESDVSITQGIPVPRYEVAERTIFKCDAVVSDKENRLMEDFELLHERRSRPNVIVSNPRNRAESIDETIKISLLDMAEEKPKRSSNDTGGDDCGIPPDRRKTVLFDPKTTDGDMSMTCVVPDARVSTSGLSISSFEPHNSDDISSKRERLRRQTIIFDTEYPESNMSMTMPIQHSKDDGVSSRAHEISQNMANDVSADVNYEFERTQIGGNMSMTVPILQARNIVSKNSVECTQLGGNMSMTCELPAIRKDVSDRTRGVDESRAEVVRRFDGAPNVDKTKTTEFHNHTNNIVSNPNVPLSSFSESVVNFHRVENQTFDRSVRPMESNVKKKPESQLGNISLNSILASVIQSEKSSQKEEYRGDIVESQKVKNMTAQNVSVDVDEFYKNEKCYSTMTLKPDQMDVDVTEKTTKTDNTRSLLLMENDIHMDIFNGDSPILPRLNSNERLASLLGATDTQKMNLIRKDNIELLQKECESADDSLNNVITDVHSSTLKEFHNHEDGANLSIGDEIIDNPLFIRVSEKTVINQSIDENDPLFDPLKLSNKKTIPERNDASLMEQTDIEFENCEILNTRNISASSQVDEIDPLMFSAYKSTAMSITGISPLDSTNLKNDSHQSIDIDLDEEKKRSYDVDQSNMSLTCGNFNMNKSVTVANPLTFDSVSMKSFTFNNKSEFNMKQTYITMECNPAMSMCNISVNKSSFINEEMRKMINSTINQTIDLQENISKEEIEDFNFAANHEDNEPLSINTDGGTDKNKTIESHENEVKLLNCTVDQKNEKTVELLSTTADEAIDKNKTIERHINEVKHMNCTVDQKHNEIVKPLITTAYKDAEDKNSTIDKTLPHQIDENIQEPSKPTSVNSTFAQDEIAAKDLTNVDMDCSNKKLVHQENVFDESYTENQTRDDDNDKKEENTIDGLQNQEKDLTPVKPEEIYEESYMENKITRNTSHSISYNIQSTECVINNNFDQNRTVNKSIHIETQETKSQDITTNKQNHTTNISMQHSFHIQMSLQNKTLNMEEECMFVESMDVEPIDENVRRSIEKRKSGDLEEGLHEEPSKKCKITDPDTSIQGSNSGFIENISDISLINVSSQEESKANITAEKTISRNASVCVNDCDSECASMEANSFTNLRELTLREAIENLNLDRHDCEPEITLGEEWSFLLFWGTVRLKIKFEKPLFETTNMNEPIRDVVFNELYMETPSGPRYRLRKLGLKMVYNYFKLHSNSENCLKSGNLPEFLTLCAHISKDARRWCSEMYYYYTTFAIGLNEKSLEFRVMRPLKRIMWNVRVKLEGLPYTNFDNISIESVCGKCVTVNNLKEKIGNIDKNWNYLPQIIEKIDDIINDSN